MDLNSTGRDEVGFQFPKRIGGADGVTPAQFPASGQRAGGEPSKGGLTSPIT